MVEVFRSLLSLLYFAKELFGKCKILQKNVAQNEYFVYQDVNLYVIFYILAGNQLVILKECIPCYCYDDSSRHCLNSGMLA